MPDNYTADWAGGTPADMNPAKGTNHGGGRVDGTASQQRIANGGRSLAHHVQGGRQSAPGVYSAGKPMAGNPCRWYWPDNARSQRFFADCSGSTAHRFRMPKRSGQTLRHRLGRPSMTFRGTASELTGRLMCYGNCFPVPDVAATTKMGSVTFNGQIICRSGIMLKED